MGSKIKEAIWKAVGSPQFSHSNPKHCLKHVSGLWIEKKKKYRRLRVRLLAKGHKQVELCTSYQFLGYVSQSNILRRIFFIRSVLTVPPSSSIFYFFSQLLADNKRAFVAANTVTSASESLPIDTEKSACSEDVTSPRFKEVAVQCDILHETSIGKGRLRLDIILHRFFIAP